MKNGTEIYRKEDISTTNAWTPENYNFTDDIKFVTNVTAVFRFELLPYCLTGNGAAVAAWDIDEVNITASCVPFIFTPIIEGIVSTEAGRAVKNVIVHRIEEPSSQNNQDVLTNEYGQYIFEQNSPGQQYTLSADKNTDFKNGVSTLDLITIQKHLLGLRNLSSPYQMIAADANHSNTVSVIDLIELRKLILGVYTELPHNTSWRFGNANSSLESTYPWGFKETIEIEALGEDIKSANFVAVKIGDVNNDARPTNITTGVGTRTNKSVDLFIKDLPVKTGASVKIDITSSNFTDVVGFQMALQLQNMIVTEVVGGKLDLQNENFNITNDGVLNLSWNTFNPLSFEKDDVLFSFIAVPGISGNLSDLIRLDDSGLQAEAYTGDNLEKTSLDLKVVKPGNASGTNALFQNEPNPFSTSTDIRFRLENAGAATVRIFDLSGHLLKEINGLYESGMNKVRISNNDLGIKNGILICQLQSNGFVAVQRMVVLQ